MACRLTESASNSTDPARLAAWWAEVLGYDVVDSDADGNRDDRAARRPAARAGSRADLRRVPDPTPGRRRLHLDLNATDRPQAAGAERLLALGARHADVGQTGEESWVVLADPEGNEFCLLASTVPPL